MFEGVKCASPKVHGWINSARALYTGVCKLAWGDCNAAMAQVSRSTLTTPPLTTHLPHPPQPTPAFAQMTALFNLEHVVCRVPMVKGGRKKKGKSAKPPFSEIQRMRGVEAKKAAEKVLPKLARVMDKTEHALFYPAALCMHELARMGMDGSEGAQRFYFGGSPSAFTVGEPKFTTRDNSAKVNALSRNCAAVVTDNLKLLFPGNLEAAKLVLNKVRQPALPTVPLCPPRPSPNADPALARSLY